MAIKYTICVILMIKLEFFIIIIIFRNHFCVKKVPFLCHPTCVGAHDFSHAPPVPPHRIAPGRS